MWKKIVTLLLVLIMIFSFIACAKEPSAQDIVDGVIESFNNIRTYQLDMNVAFDMTGEEEGEVFENIQAMKYNGTIDVENKQMRMEMTAERIPKTVQPEMLLDDEIYYIDGILYIMSKVPRYEPTATWIKQEVPEEWWEEFQQMGWGESQIKILESAQAEVISSERVEGIDCYVLEVTPDLAQLWRLSYLLHFDEAPDVTEAYLEEVFHNFSVKQWIAKDTFFLAKSEIDIAIEFPPEEAGLSTLDIAMVLLSYDYNQPVSIELPPEAEEAIEMPME